MIPRMVAPITFVSVGILSAIYGIAELLVPVCYTLSALIDIFTIVFSGSVRIGMGIALVRYGG